MELIIIAVIVFLIVRHFKKKKARPVQVVSVGDPSALPDTLAELREMRVKAKKPEIEYQCRRKICDVGIQLFHEDKIVNDPGSEYDVSKLLTEMYELIHDSHFYAYLPVDKELEFRCLDVGVQMSEKLNPPSPADGGVFKFLDYAWSHLADMYVEGEVCPRNPAKARKYYRMRIIYEARIKDTSVSALKGLMEVPNAGEDGRQEILKFIALKYGIGAVQIKNREIVRNFQAQPIQQAAELLFEMDWTKIGGSDISVMLAEYQKGADAGNAYAQYKLGEFYLKGRYVAKDEAKGLELLEKAAAQDLYLAVDKLNDHYYWLANPYAGDYKGASKKQIQEWKALYSKWNKRAETLLSIVETKYANSFTEYIRNSADLPTRGPGMFAAMEDDARSGSNEDSLESADRESPFSILDLPDVITGPYGVTYRKQSVSTYSADYYSDHGDTATIHVSDIGMAGNSAKNNYGYFYW